MGEPMREAPMSSNSVVANASALDAHCLAGDETALAVLRVSLRPLTGGHEVAARQIAASRGVRLTDSMRLIATPYRVAMLSAAGEVLNSVPYTEITTFEVSRDGLRAMVVVGIRGVPVYLRGRRRAAREFAVTVARLRAA